MSTSFFELSPAPAARRNSPWTRWKVPDDGVYARCSECSTVFFVERPPALRGPAEGGEAGTPAVGSAPCGGGGAGRHPPPRVSTPTSSRSIPVRGDGGMDTVVEEPAAVEREAGAAAPPPPAPEPEPEVGFRMEVDLPPPSPGASPLVVGIPMRRPGGWPGSWSRTWSPTNGRGTPGRWRPAPFRRISTRRSGKSWEEYTQQVGRELAEQTTYFRDALNDILAGGRAGGADLF